MADQRKGTRILREIIDDESRLRCGAKRDLHIALPDVGAAGPFLLLAGTEIGRWRCWECRYGLVLLPSWVSCVKRGELWGELHESRAGCLYSVGDGAAGKRQPTNETRLGTWQRLTNEKATGQKKGPRPPNRAAGMVAAAHWSVLVDANACAPQPQDKMG